MTNNNFEKYHAWDSTKASNSKEKKSSSEDESRGKDFLASEELATAVNAALAIQQPLLITGEPGTGKTTLADSVAYQLGLGQVLTFYTRSDHQSRDILYTFDAMWRLSDIQTREISQKTFEDSEKYIRYQALGEAIKVSHEKNLQRVVLIDEIDKASRDFPNDLLNEIDRMQFKISETGKSFQAQKETKPIVIITSNSERQLPDAFLRRCVFHYINFPKGNFLLDILVKRLNITNEPLLKLAKTTVDCLEKLRALDLIKKPSTSELINWFNVLKSKNVQSNTEELSPEKLSTLPFLGVLLKTKTDIDKVRNM